MLRLLQRLVARPRLMRALGALSGSINPWHLDVRRDPYPAYRRLRAQPRLARLRLLGGYVATAYEDVERPGDVVVALLAEANRDPERFPDPDRFDVGRSENRHLAFGPGSHHCLGAALARLETEAALGGLLRRFPDFQGPPRPRGWKASVVRRGPTALSLRLG